MRLKQLTILFPIVLSIMGVSDLSAQDITHNDNIENYLSSMFQYLDMSKVSTGYLKDRAIETIDFFAFNGLSPNSSDADLEDLYNSLLTANSAKVNNVASEYNVNSVMSAFSDTTAIVLGATLFKYNYIVSNAVTDSLIVFNGGKLYDCYRQGIWQNPYAEAYAFVFAPSFPLHIGTNVKFKFSSANITSNCSIQQTEIDFGDGNGYRTVSGSYTPTIVYGTSGTKNLKMRITLTGGVTLQGHALLQLEDPPMSQYGSGNEPDDQEVICLNYDSSVFATVSYKYAENHNNQMIRPLIFVEGFDDPLVGLLTSFSSNPLTYIHNWIHGKGRGEFTYDWLYKKLQGKSDILNNYDIVYVDWGNPQADIRDNAALLKQIIRSVNHDKVYQSIKNTIVGHSMGGLIVRYALRSMELQNETHETGHFVSFDAPHLGVNVPLGAQYALWDA